MSQSLDYRITLQAMTNAHAMLCDTEDSIRKQRKCLEACIDDLKRQITALAPKPQEET